MCTVRQRPETILVSYHGEGRRDDGPVSQLFILWEFILHQILRIYDNIDDKTVNVVHAWQCSVGWGGPFKMTKFV